MARKKHVQDDEREDWPFGPKDGANYIQEDNKEFFRVKLCDKCGAVYEYSTQNNLVNGKRIMQLFQYNYVEFPKFKLKKQTCKSCDKTEKNLIVISC